MSPILAARFLDKTSAKKTFDSPSKNNNEKEKNEHEKNNTGNCKALCLKSKRDKHLFD